MTSTASHHTPHPTFREWVDYVLKVERVSRYHQAISNVQLTHLQIDNYTTWQYFMPGRITTNQWPLYWPCDTQLSLHEEASWCRQTRITLTTWTAIFSSNRSQLAGPKDIQSTSSTLDRTRQLYSNCHIIHTVSDVYWIEHSGKF
jgi:hypothetical protein